MNPVRFLLPTAAALAAVALAAQTSAPKSERSDRDARRRSTGAATVAAPARAGEFDAFRIIGDRNIFNPTRTGRSIRSTEDASLPRPETIALVGTLQTEQGELAIFDSETAAFRQAVAPGRTIAGFTVKSISADAVELAPADGRPLTLRVNQQLRRLPGAAWRVTARDGVPRTEVARPALPSATVPAIPNDASEVLRRLMEQRQKQLKQ
jgi:hypothetical protein